MTHSVRHTVCCVKGLSVFAHSMDIQLPCCIWTFSIERGYRMRNHERCLFGYNALLDSVRIEIHISFVDLLYQAFTVPQLIIVGIIDCCSCFEKKGFL